MDPGVHALQYMDAISGKDLGYRINFYHNLREILNLIPKVRGYESRGASVQLLHADVSM